MLIKCSKSFTILLLLFACAKPQPYVASRAYLEKLQPGRVIIPTRKGCDVCHKVLSEKVVYKYYKINISHKSHVRLGIECIFCHRKASSSTRMDDFLMPEGHGFSGDDGDKAVLDENPCRVCHLYSSEREKGNRLIPATCSKCHSSYSEGKPLPFKWISMRTNLINNHKAHYDKGIPCLRCHAGFDQVEDIVPNYVPKMDICTECHGATGEQRRAAEAGVGDEFEAARQTFRRNCAMCHGIEGKGDGAVSAFFRKGLKARDLTDHEYMSRRTDGDIFWVIFAGGPVMGLSERMPAFKGLLSGGEISSLIKYIRHISEKPEYPVSGQ